MAEEPSSETFHPQSIKLPEAVEIFANLQNAQKFAIDIGESPLPWSFLLPTFIYNKSVVTKLDRSVCFRTLRL